MKTSSSFGNLRRRIAPMIRPILERCPPVRSVAVRLLKMKQSGELQRCGMEFQLPSGDFGVTLEAESTGEYEPVTTSLIADMLQEGMTFVDIGAHVGLFALPATKWVGETGRVVAFEPHPDNYKMLMQNIERNFCATTIEAIQSAVSDIAKTVHLHTSTFNTGDHQLFHRGNRNTIEVPCTTLDTFFDSDEQVDVIKMDLQGAEAAAFRGMQRVLEDNANIKIIWELSPAQLEDAGSSAGDVLAWLKQQGFCFTIVDDATGDVLRSSMQDVLDACPHDSYVNVLCERDAQ